MKREVRKLIERRLSVLKAGRDQMVIDADTHISDPLCLPDDLIEKAKSDPSYFHGRPISAEQLISEMDLTGVDMSLCWQNPSATPYGEDRSENADRLLAANRYVAQSSRQYPERLFPAGWTDPKALGLEKALELVDICINDLGMSIIKMNPAQNAYPIESDMVLAVVDRIIALGAVPAFHFGADTVFTPASGLETVAKRHPEHPVIAVHFGGGGAGYVEAERLYVQARELGLRQKNIYFVQSAKRDTHMEADLITYRLAESDKAWKRIFLASDAPYGRQSWNFGGFAAMLSSLARGGDGSDPRHSMAAPLFDESCVQDFMGRNFADFGIAFLERFLDAQKPRNQVKTGAYTAR